MMPGCRINERGEGLAVIAVITVALIPFLEVAVMQRCDSVIGLKNSRSA